MDYLNDWTDLELVSKKLLICLPADISSSFNEKFESEDIEASKSLCEQPEVHK